MIERETRIYKIKGSKENLEVLERVLRHIEYLGEVGCSRNILVRIDGDGDGRIKVFDENGQKLDNEKYSIEQEKINSIVSSIYDIG